MAAIEGEYNGKPSLTLTRGADEKYPFSFGVEKAQRILDNLDAIRAFVTKNKGQGGGRGSSSQSSTHGPAGERQAGGYRAPSYGSPAPDYSKREG